MADVPIAGKIEGDDNKNFLNNFKFNMLLATCTQKRRDRVLIM